MPIPPFVVPAITSAEAKKLFQIFKPIRIKDGKAFLITTQDLNNSFLWNAEQESKPYKGDLFTLYRFHSVHSFSYHGMFKPSIAEVVAQIPSIYHYLKEVYFETVGPEDSHDFNMWSEHMEAGVHVARTTLYVAEPTHKLNMSLGNKVVAAVSAVRWMEAMKPEERVQAMKFFCHKCGEKNPCPKCEKK